MTETEPEFDANERSDWYELWEFEQLLCPHCGNLRSVCSNPDTDWYPQKLWCGASATREMVSRRWHEKHREAKPDSVGFLPTDGVMFWASTEDLTPDDNFL